METGQFYAYKNPHRTYLFRKSEGEDPRMYQASKNPEVLHYVRKPVTETEYVYNTEYPKDFPYVHATETGYEIREGQKVKPGQYVMKDDVGEYPINPSDFDRTYHIRAGQGIINKREYYTAVVKPTDYVGEFERFETSNAITPPLYNIGDFKRKGSKYPINEKVFLKGYRLH